MQKRGLRVETVIIASVLVLAAFAIFILASGIFTGAFFHRGGGAGGSGTPSGASDGAEVTGGVGGAELTGGNTIDIPPSDDVHFEERRYRSQANTPFIKFPLTGIPENAEIINATLHLEAFRVSGRRGPLLVASRCDGEWSEAMPSVTNLSCRSTGSSTTIRSAILYSWDVTGAVGEAFNEDKTDITIRLNSTLFRPSGVVRDLNYLRGGINDPVERAKSFADFYAREAGRNTPVLRVTYTEKFFPGVCGDNVCTSSSSNLLEGESTNVTFGSSTWHVTLFGVGSDGSVIVDVDAISRIIGPGNTLTINGLPVKNHARVYCAPPGCIGSATLVFGENENTCPEDCG